MLINMLMKPDKKMGLCGFFALLSSGVSNLKNKISHILKLH